LCMQVGIGYKGQERIMCFLCEHQWEDPDFGLGRRVLPPSLPPSLPLSLSLSSLFSCGHTHTHTHTHTHSFLSRSARLSLSLSLSICQEGERVCLYVNAWSNVLLMCC